MTLSPQDRDTVRHLAALPSIQFGPFARGGIAPRLLAALEAAEKRVAALEPVAGRLAAVLAIHTPTGGDGDVPLLCAGCLEDWPCTTDRAARGETP